MKLEHMSERFAAEVCGWRYGGEYSVYNLPDWGDAAGFALSDPLKREREFCAFTDGERGLVAFTRRTARPDGVMLGAGVNPEYLSQGCGSRAVLMTAELIQAERPGARIFLHVRTWNARAVRCYEKAGFVIEKTFEQRTPAGAGEFYLMALHT